MVEPHISLAGGLSVVAFNSMASASVLFVRHAAAVISDAAPPRNWPLSNEGRRAASALGKRLHGLLADWPDQFVSSSERKAIETARELDSSPPTIDDRLREVSKPWYPDAAGHEADAILYLQGSELPGWEPQLEAIERFSAAVERSDRFAALVTHGTVMSLWLASRLKSFDPVAFWLELRFPDAYLLRSRGHGGDQWEIERL